MDLSALKGLKAKALQHIAFLTGVPSAGTKSHLLGQLQGTLQSALLPNAKTRLRNSNTRILSVDMGIRNLAYCVIDVPALHHQQADSRLRVQAWKRLDLLEKMKPQVLTELPLPESSSEDVKGKVNTTSQAILKNSFTPSVMSKVALQVAQDFLAYRPDIILIERQRFRSGGGSAIQEWTVRVNTLESMLWACFETLKHTYETKSGHQAFPAIHEVSPKRVANFWTSSREAQSTPENLFAAGYKPPALHAVSSTTKTGKQEKIAVLRSWLGSYAFGDGGVSLEFTSETQSTAEAFYVARVARKRIKKDALAADPTRQTKTKLDDLADCVLQGVAWVRWEWNRRAILESYQNSYHLKNATQDVERRSTE